MKAIGAEIQIKYTNFADKASEIAEFTIRRQLSHYILILQQHILDAVIELNDKGSTASYEEMREGI